MLPKPPHQGVDISLKQLNNTLHGFEQYVMSTQQIYRMIKPSIESSNHSDSFLRVQNSRISCHTSHYSQCLGIKIPKNQLSFFQVSTLPLPARTGKTLLPHSCFNCAHWLGFTLQRRMYNHCACNLYQPYFQYVSNTGFETVAALQTVAALSLNIPAPPQL